MNQRDQAPASDYKKASINWLLTVGQVSDGAYANRKALATLAERGVDYDLSDQPDFGRVAVKDGDSFTDATYAEAVGATIYPLGADPDNWDDRFEFHIAPDDWNSLVLGAIIRGVIATGADGEAGWRTRAETGR
jgi:hypothetical protein